MHWLPRVVFLSYFITHIPITVAIDAQALLPIEWYPRVLQTLVQDYALYFQDPFMAMRQPFPWFSSFIVCELLFQMPFFFVAIWGLWNKKNIIRIPCLVYGSHVATTVLPIAAHLLYADFKDGEIGPRSMKAKAAILAIYAPYFIIPVWLVLHMSMGDPFPAIVSAKKTK